MSIMYISCGMRGLEYGIYESIEIDENGREIDRGKEIDIGLDGMVDYELFRNDEDGEDDEWNEIKWEMMNRFGYVYLIGICKGFGVEKVYDSEGSILCDLDEYEKLIMEYCLDRLDNYY